jgi:UV excision repair protein RAD23
MAQMMGMTVEQLQQTSQMISQMPPEEYAQYMNMAAGIRGMDMGNIANLMSGGAGGGGQVLRLNEEEMAAVNRLTEMGFDRTEAAQAYLACDKNEALAANLLMDGGFGGMGGGDYGEGDGGEGEEDGDMYD